MNKSLYLSVVFVLLLGRTCHSQRPTASQPPRPEAKYDRVVTGAERLDEYLPMLAGKGVGLIANPTSVCGNRHLVDTLKALGVDLKVVFAPEHGFRGEAEAGEKVSGGVDRLTGIRVVSLYGNNKKPSVADLKGCEVVLFDIQDVGVRFYTYISTLELVMEACAENNVRLIVLDRPNPNGHIVDGPVLDTAFRSFVGMQPIPILHGMSMGEYAQMLNGEAWLKNKLKCDLRVVEVVGWRHADEYMLPVPPSPNLPNQASVRLYASLCLFEGTLVSLGRGTPLPFQCYGYPENPNGSFSFTPVSIPGKAKNPPQEGKLCIGERLDSIAFARRPTGLELRWLISAWKNCPDSLRSTFFTTFFEKLAGNTTLRTQIRNGLSEEEIKASWQPGIQAFQAIRQKYLLYP
ncbi:MAG: exo-beta-N-acetylmuramidase NamZ domain-containing protein [Bacteroidota bacterium]